MAPNKPYMAPKVWKRPFSSIYNDNYRYGTSLYSEAITDLERKELVPMTGSTLAISTRARPVFYYSSLPNPISTSFYSTSPEPLDHLHYLGHGPTLESIAASRDAVSRRTEAAIAAAEATLASSELAINRSRAIEKMEAELHEMSGGASGASNMMGTLGRGSSRRGLSPSAGDFSSGSVLGSDGEVYSPRGAGLAVGGGPGFSQNRWYTNAVRSVRPDVYIEAHQFRSLMV